MNAFNKRYDSLFDFFSVEGWDGYCAKPVDDVIRRNAEYVWEFYGLEHKEHTLIGEVSGTVTFEVRTIHGLLEIYVDREEFIASIDKVMPDVIRRF